MAKGTYKSKALGITALWLLWSAHAAVACSVVVVYTYQRVPTSFSVVFYRDDVPLRNSKATLYLQKGERPPVLLRSYETDANGQVALANLQPGRYLLSVTKDDAEQTAAVEVVPEGKDLGTQVVSRFASPPPPKLREPIPVQRLHGVILDSTGAVVPGVKVHITPESVRGFNEADVVSDSVGGFEAAAPEGRYLLTLDAMARRY